MDNTKDKLYLELCYLISCSLHKVKPDTSEIDIPSVMSFAEYHGVTILASKCLDKAAFPSIKSAINRKMYGLVLMDNERKELLSYCDSHDIWYMPLKGTVISSLYPSFGMREMCDNDILYDSSKQDVLLPFFKERGYSYKLNYGADDEFTKPPVYNFEMHRVLFVPDQNTIWSKYYENVKGKLIKNDGDNCGYHFSDEDFYIYIMAHNAKHYNNQGGSGVRCLVDCYVYLIEKNNQLQPSENSLDWNYIENEERKLGILEFEKLVRDLSKKLFCNAAYPNNITDEDMKNLRFFMESGTYGTIEHKVEKQENKWSYLWKRIVPDDVWLQSYVPMVYKHKLLLPFFVIGRLWKNRTRAWKELKLIIKK